MPVAVVPALHSVLYFLNVMANVLGKKTNQITDEKKKKPCFNGNYLVALACRSILPVFDRRTVNIPVVITNVLSFGVKHSVFFNQPSLKLLLRAFMDLYTS